MHYTTVHVHCTCTCTCTFFILMYCRLRVNRSWRTSITSSTPVMSLTYMHWRTWIRYSMRWNLSCWTLVNNPLRPTSSLLTLKESGVTFTWSFVWGVYVHVHLLYSVHVHVHVTQIYCIVHVHVCTVHKKSWSIWPVHLTCTCMCTCTCVQCIWQINIVYTCTSCVCGINVVVHVLYMQYYRNFYFYYQL